ncbi:MAG: fatty acid oxidation complex subunit alpha FadJ [Calditrichaeota bacterium]|nr:MAG: fatty acid oxidation complex subunit alpha FadJ [Calditrichota bacterium]
MAEEKNKKEEKLEPKVEKKTAGSKKSGAPKKEVKAPKKPPKKTVAKVEKASPVKPEKTPPAKIEKKAKDSHFKLSEKDGIGLLQFDMAGKKVNIFNEEVLRELEAVCDKLVDNTSMRALIITSAKKTNFIAGADINGIKDITDPKEGEMVGKEGQKVFGKFSYLPMPTIAFINGTCMGGGTELSLAADYRISVDVPHVKIGLPEVMLGILPGWGGTQRLPRLIGIQKALDYILTGRRVPAKKAFRDGIIDQLIPAEIPENEVLPAVYQFTESILTPAGKAKVAKKRKRGQNAQTFLLEKNPLGRKVLFDQARKMVLKTSKGHYPAPLRALEAVQKGMATSLSEGLAIEAQFLGELVVTPVCKSLVKVYFLTEELKKDNGAPEFKGESLKFDRVGVLGAGIMGGGIAQLLAQNNHPVRMKDINLPGIAKGMEQASKVFSGMVKKRRMRPNEMADKMGLISGTTDYSGFQNVNLVIEAIIEKLDIKKAVLAEVDKIVPANSIIASNTSSLPITEMAAATARPEKVAGLHFFNPVHRMPLVEVIRGEQSSDETIVSLVDFSRALGKTPIVVKDSPGFLVNRILAPYMNEAAMLLEEGQKIDYIDKAMVQFGMPMGPLELYDEVGIDVTHKVAGILQEAYGDRMPASAVVEKMFESGRLGKKSGAGFYKYNNRKKDVDPETYKTLASLRTDATAIPVMEIKERCVLMMINEAARCLEDGVVRSARDVDIGMIFGTGFPPFLGGLLNYADNLGAATVLKKLNHFTQKCGPRFEPAPLIKEMAAKEKSFYA